jgi:hypothetical protein
MKLASISFKRLFILLVLHAAVFFSNAQNIRLAWVKTIPSSHGTRLVLDSNKYVIVLGAFSGTVDFDPGPGVFNMTSISNNDLYIAKYDTSGNFIWAKQLGGQQGLVEYDLQIDKHGNLFILGLFTGPVDFDPGPGQHVIIPGNSPTFLLKLDHNGNFSWVEQLPYALNTLNIDILGDLIIGGDFSGTQDFDPGAGTFTATANGLDGAEDMAVIKLDSSGNFIWMRQIKNLGTSSPQTYGLKSDMEGSVYLAGAFSSTLDFDPGAGITSLTAAGLEDGFLLKLDKDGNFAWARQFGAEGSDEIVGLEVDKYGSVYTTGAFQKSVDFDPGPADFILTATGLYTCFISKLDKNGNFVYAKNFQSGTTAGQALAIDSSNNLYISGYFIDSVDFDPGPGVYKVGGYDLFTTKLDGYGNFVWVAPYIGTSDNYFESIYSAIKVDVLKNVYFTGEFTGTVDFDPDSTVYPVTSPGGGFETYLHKLSQGMNTLKIINVDTCDSFSLNDSIYSSPGTYYQTLTNSAGYDSIIQLNLTRKEVFSQLSVTTCGSYLWKGRLLTTTGIYNDTLPAVTACDSIVQLNLTLTSTLTVVNKTVCGSYLWNGSLLTASGIYIDTLKLANGCDSVVSLNLQVHLLPLPFLGKDTALCLGDSVTLSPGNFNAYTWSNNTTGNTLIAVDPGEYWVQVTDTNNCTATDSIRISSSSQCSCVLDAQTRIYPTPFSDFLIVDKKTTECEVRMNLYDILGQLLEKDVLIQNGLNKIPLTLPSGIYIYMFHSRGKILLTGKILKLQ